MLPQELLLSFPPLTQGVFSTHAVALTLVPELSCFPSAYVLPHSPDYLVLSISPNIWETCVIPPRIAGKHAYLSKHNFL